MARGNRAKMTVSGTPGTGSVTLGAAYSNAWLTFAEAGIADGAGVTCLFEDGTDFELTRCTYTASGTSLARNTVIISKSGGTKGTSKLSLTSAAKVTLVAAAEDGRELLVAARSYYVRTDGSDSNSGLANTSGAAFLTLQKALNVVFGALDLGGQNVTINVADGTYTTTVATTQTGGQVGAGTISIVGNTATPANVVLNATGDNTLVFDGNGSISIDGCEIRSGNAYGLKALNGFKVTIGNNVRAGACSAAQFYAQIYGRIIFGTAINIVGGATSFVRCADQGYAALTGMTVTLTGTPAFSAATYVATGLSKIAAATVTYSGIATATRYTVDQSSVLDTGGATTSVPGGTAGTTASGGQAI